MSVPRHVVIVDAATAEAWAMGDDEPMSLDKFAEAVAKAVEEVNELNEQVQIVLVIKHVKT